MHCYGKFYWLYAILAATISTAVLFAESTQSAYCQVSTVSSAPYIAQVQRANSPILTIVCDGRRYYTRYADSVYYYDGNANSYIRWQGSAKTKSVGIASQLAMERLYDLIKRQGIDQISSRCGIAAPLLERFMRIHQPGMPPRALDHPLYVFTDGGRGWTHRYKRAGMERVAGLPCEVYTAIGANDHIWVESSTRCVVRRRSVYRSMNPRMPDSVDAYQVISFRRVRAIPPGQFRIPAGYTAVLPGILKDLPLPPGVKRKVLSGKDAFLGFDLSAQLGAAERLVRHN